MTKISQIYDALVDVIEAQLTSYVRLPNPYAPEENTFLHLKQGFGVAIGPGQDTERYVGCLVTWERTYNIILVRQLVTTQNNTGARETIEKSILDDHDKLRKSFYLNSTLGGIAIKSTVLNDGGVNFLASEEHKFLSMELQLFIEYQENPNS